MAHGDENQRARSVPDAVVGLTGADAGAKPGSLHIYVVSRFLCEVVGNLWPTSRSMICHWNIVGCVPVSILSNVSVSEYQSHPQISAPRAANDHLLVPERVSRR